MLFTKWHALQNGAKHQVKSTMRNASKPWISSSAHISLDFLEDPGNEYELFEPVGVAIQNDCDLHKTSIKMGSVAVGTTVAMFVILLSITLLVRGLTQRGYSLHCCFAGGERLAEVRASAATPSQSYKLMRYLCVTVVCCNINYGMVLPAAVQDFQGAHGVHLTASGFWIGSYALGALISLPVFAMVPVKQIRRAFILHGIFTVIGNVMMVIAANSGSFFGMFIGRVIAGMEAGAKLSVDGAVLQLYRRDEMAEAVFTTRVACAMGIALGPGVGPFASWIQASVPFTNHLFRTEAARREAFPLCLMVVYGMVYLLCVLFNFKDPEHVEGNEEGDLTSKQAPSHNSGRVVFYTAMVFLSVLFTNFTRIFIRLAWESSAMVILAHEYCIGSIAGYIISSVAGSLVLSRNLITQISLTMNDSAKMMRMLEACTLCTMPLLFRFGGPSAMTLVVFLAISTIFYNANAAQSGVLLLIGSEATIPDNRFLDKKALTTYYFISNICAFGIGPSIAMLGLDWNLSQNTAAWILVVAALLQWLVTFSTVRSARKITEAKGVLVKSVRKDNA